MTTHSMVKCNNCGDILEHSFSDNSIPLTDHWCGNEMYIGRDPKYFTPIDVDILPCPHCGGRGSLHSDGGCKDFAIACSECSASTKVWGFDSTALKAIDEWNDRTGQPLGDIGDEVKDDIRKLYSLCSIKYGNSDPEVGEFLDQIRMKYII